MTAVLAAIAPVFVLGLVLGFSPTTYAIAIRLLSRRGGVLGVHVLTAGLVFGTVLLLAIFRALDPESVIAAFEGHVKAWLVRRSVNLLAAVVFGLLAVRAWHRARQPRRHTGPRELAGRIGADGASGPAPASRPSTAHDAVGAPDSEADPASVSVSDSVSTSDSASVSTSDSASTSSSAAAPASVQDPAPRSPRRLFLLGMAGVMVGVSGPTTAYVVGRTITAATHALALQLVLYAVFVVAAGGQYVLMALLWERVPAIPRVVTLLERRAREIDPRPLVALALTLVSAACVVLAILGI